MRPVVFLFSVAACLSASGFWEDKTGDVKITSGAVAITEDDKPSADVTGINIYYGATLWITNLTTRWEMTIPVSGAGKILIENCATNLVINADNSAYVGAKSGQPASITVQDAGTTVVVSNRYGLGSSSSLRPASACSSHSFKFGGAGLTNDVAITGGNYEFVPQWPDETGTFVQNASLAYNMFRFRNAEVTGGTLGTLNASKIEVEEGCSLTVGTNVHVIAGAGASSAALGLGAAAEGASGRLFYWGTSRTNSWRYVQIYGVDTKIVCIGEDAFNTRVVSNGIQDFSKGYMTVHNSVVKPTLDLNGYDQRVPWISTYTYSSDNTRLAVTSAAPATLVFTCENAGSVNKGDFVFQGAAGFRYAGADGTEYNMRRGISETAGGLSVVSGTLVLGVEDDNSKVPNFVWGGPLIEASGTGILRLAANAFGIPRTEFTYGDEDGKASKLVISGSAKVHLDPGATNEVGFLVSQGVEYRKGVYGSQAACDAGLVPADHVVPGLSGEGVLKVHRSPRFGVLIIIR